MNHPNQKKMTAMDKAGIGIVIVITVVAVAFTMAAQSGFESPTMAAPVSKESTPSDPFADIAEKTKQREQAIEEQMKMLAKETPSFEEEAVTVSTPRIEDVPEMTGPMTVQVSLPSGSSVPGCEEILECFVPTSVTINAGDTVSWSNDDTAAHTVTSGTPAGGPDGVFDSSLFMAGATFDVTFDNSGSYDYFCMVHPWMVANVQVN